MLRLLRTKSSKITMSKIYYSCNEDCFTWYNVYVA